MKQVQLLKFFFFFSVWKEKCKINLICAKYFFYV